MRGRGASWVRTVMPWPQAPPCLPRSTLKWHQPPPLSPPSTPWLRGHPPQHRFWGAVSVMMVEASLEEEGQSAPPTPGRLLPPFLLFGKDSVCPQGTPGLGGASISICVLWPPSYLCITGSIVKGGCAPTPLRPLLPEAPSEADSDKTQQQRGTHRTGRHGGPAWACERTGDHTAHAEREREREGHRTGSWACSWQDNIPTAAPQRLAHRHTPLGGPRKGVTPFSPSTHGKVGLKHHQQVS